MQRARHGVADDQIHQCTLPRSASVQHPAEPEPEERDARDFEAPRPPAARGASRVEVFLVQIHVRVRVQVEARKSHDDVEELVLHREYDARERVKGHCALVV